MPALRLADSAREVHEPLVVLLPEVSAAAAASAMTGLVARRGVLSTDTP
ncbi:hypothetical protein I553_7259 [Mycobacterium xenopi 4042]|uniref:Uncharacterized protein n=1 Tax=Mycobacterium xenopi 4042 TaxID=1299334 RepID=X8E5Y9_MYCXE|nr:hypothetical protein I553_7259 [Mycobacterium xenopi 4042]